MQQSDSKERSCQGDSLSMCPVSILHRNGDAQKTSLGDHSKVMMESKAEGWLRFRKPVLQKVLKVRISFLNRPGYFCSLYFYEFIFSTGWGDPSYRLYTILCLTTPSSFEIIARMDSHLPKVTSLQDMALGRDMFRMVYLHFTFPWMAKGKKTQLCALIFMSMWITQRVHVSYSETLKNKQSLCFYVCVPTSCVELSEIRFKIVNSQMQCI